MSSLSDHIRSAVVFSSRKQFSVIRYFFAGTLISLGYTVTIIAIVEWLAWKNPEGANAVSLTIWTLISYLIHRNFTFQYDGDYAGSAMRFFLIFIAKLATSVGVMALITRYYQSTYLIGILLNWVMLPLIAYIMMKLWVFQVDDRKLRA